MPDRDYNRPVLTDEGRPITAWFKDFFSQFSLAWNLVWDNRVPFVAKLIPIATAAYLILPIDFVPDPALGLGQLDDLAILLIGLKLFVDVCPPELVKLYRYGIGHAQPETPVDINDEAIIDLEAEAPTDDTQSSSPNVSEN